MKINFSSIWFLVVLLGCLSSCKKTDELTDFTEEDEVSLGEKLANAIVEDEEFNIISPEGNTIPYSYATSRLLEITSTSIVSKSEEFTWTIYLIDDDNRQAFAFPGGHIFISSGMIFFLDNEDQFAGLIAHLVAHIDQSHITEALFFKYGINGLKSIASSGNTSDLKSIINDLELSNEFLTFSRGNEIQADTLAISMLAETSQACDAVGLVFTKTLNVQSTQQAQLIAAHLLEQSRIEDITATVSGSGCDTQVDDQSASRYQSFRNSLP
ncbi:M48 family metalloprotease [Ekhidna sp. To15]|uniref:M48 family metalloprotease n=1 Tax=Ekhidna sp. To15 TaxID=3395267 RepID=UPI003F51DDB7